MCSALRALRQQLRTLQGQGPAVQYTAPSSTEFVTVAPPPAARGKKLAAAAGVAKASKAASASKALARGSPSPSALQSHLPPAPAPIARVDIDAPFVPPAEDSDKAVSDDDSDFDLPVSRKRAASKAKATGKSRRSTGKMTAVTMAEEGDAPPRNAEPSHPTELPAPEVVVPATQQPTAGVARRTLGPISSNVVHHMADDAAPKKRKLLGAPAVGSVDTMPPSFLLSMMGTFAPPKLRTL